MTHFRTLLVSSLLLALVGCDKVAVEDNMDDSNFLLDIRLFDVGRRANDLNGPYATGTDVEFSVVGADNTAGWRYESDNEEVMRVVSSIDGRGTVRADASGTAHIQLVDSGGDCVEEFDVEVADVADVAVTSRAIIKSEGDDIDLNMAGETLYVLEGGNATFRARYFDAAGREVRGRDILEIRSDVASTAMSNFGAFSAWITISPFSPGAEALELIINEQNVGTLNIEAVAADSLEGIQIVGDETDAEAGDQIVIRATGVRGSDAVYGTEPEWDSAGRALGRGDLYSYTYDADIETSVRASYETSGGDLEDNMTVHGALGSASSSSNLGCSASGGGGGFGALFPLGLGLLFLRRRR
ncbi:MAG: MYXO-CTERM domain-containing protein [Polyangiales bacterium]|jgi:MYXO-CTERM domain-containing protein